MNFLLVKKKKTLIFFILFFSPKRIYPSEFILQWLNAKVIRVCVLNWKKFHFFLIHSFT